ncbi:RHS repeat-associated core domain-containing protein [Streptomyces albidoflavus]
MNHPGHSTSGSGKTGYEAAAASRPEGARTIGQWNGFSQNTSLTVSGKTYAAQYGATDQSERIKLGDTFFHNGPLGLSAKSQGGTDMGFNREPGGTLNSMTTGGKAYFYLTDALGSVVAMADESGTKVNTYSYSPRGVRVLAGTDEKVKQPHQFTGGYRDDTGLYHFAARYYDPNIGRFTSQDPSGQEKNPYLYAEGDPVNRIDPSGLSSFSMGGEICYYLCLGGGYSESDDGNEGGGYFKIGLGTPSVSGGIQTSTSNIGSETDGWVYAGCGVGSLGGELTAGRSGLGVSGGLGYISTPGCSTGVQVQF